MYTKNVEKPMCLLTISCQHNLMLKSIQIYGFQLWGCKNKNILKQEQLSVTRSMRRRPKREYVNEINEGTDNKEVRRC